MSTLKTRAGVEIGVATHTGHVRTDNEDDYLVVSLPDADPPTLLLAVADGMGGLAGGSDASRAAVRALGATCTAQLADGDGIGTLRAGFEAAAAHLHEIAAANPRLADLGTTLTAWYLRGREAFLGHVGDSRCMRLRRGAVEPLTEDHALEEPRHLLTRCLGAGQIGADGDYTAVEFRPDDVIVLCTDGAWSMLKPEEIVAEFKGRSLQAACESLVRTVLARGAPDNATVLALRCDIDAIGEERDFDLPVGEVRLPLESASSGSLRASRWPYLILLLAAVLGVIAFLQARHGSGIGAIVRHWFGAR